MTRIQTVQELRRLLASGPPLSVKRATAVAHLFQALEIAATEPDLRLKYARNRMRFEGLARMKAKQIWASLIADVSV